MGCGGREPGAGRGQTADLRAHTQCQPVGTTYNSYTTTVSRAYTRRCRSLTLTVSPLFHSGEPSIGVFRLPRDGGGATVEHHVFVGRAGDPRPAVQPFPTLIRLRLSLLISCAPHQSPPRVTNSRIHPPPSVSRCVVERRDEKGTGYFGVSHT